MKHKFSIFKNHINVSRETLEKLVIYSELLCFWQEKMNLVSHREPAPVIYCNFSNPGLPTT